MNRRLYNNQFFVETAIYRVFVFVMDVSHILFWLVKSTGAVK
ncbi:MAG: hypothetical protein V7K84_02390 [Nostoc sp.]